ncbi:MAG: Carboxymuconolactone decarboxylase family protein [Schlesneria sp.]|nr:Carboxymuconolactone decarboxylase family protein [Schlesneria sp.]
MRTLSRWSGALCIVAVCASSWGAEISSGLTKTRPEMKKRIEALKEREARIPLPALTAEEIASGKRSVNNGRLRSIYLPESWQANRSATANTQGRTAGPQSVAANLNQQQQAPDYPFKTRLFWIVSRTNDCQYCLGHQELKLRRAGMTDDQIASLDCKWTAFPADEQAAIRLTRKITLTPHLVTDDDLAALKKHYTDAQVADIIQTVAGYNSTNRWTASTGIPQDRSFGGDEPSQLDTPTSAEFSAVETSVAPYDYKPRAAWESRAEVDAAIAACRGRSPLIKLPTMEAARQALAADTPGITPPIWCQAMAYAPQTALRGWKHRQAVARDGKLNPNLKALIAWVTARENRAWYSAAHARTRLNALGVTDDTLYSIGTNEGSFTPVEQATFAFARKLTSAPHTIVDDDVAGLRKLFSDNEVAEIIFLVCDGNSFDRVTEMLRLPLEGGSTTIGQVQ